MRKSTGSLHVTETVDIHDITWLKRFGIHSRRCTTAVASNVGACCLLHRYAASTLFRKFSSSNDAFLKMRRYTTELLQLAVRRHCTRKTSRLLGCPSTCADTTMHQLKADHGPGAIRQVSKRKLLHPAQPDEL